MVTKKGNRKCFSPQGLELWSPGSNSQHATNELCWLHFYAILNEKLPVQQFFHVLKYNVIMIKHCLAGTEKMYIKCWFVKSDVTFLQVSKLDSELSEGKRLVDEAVSREKELSSHVWICTSTHSISKVQLSLEKGTPLYREVFKNWIVACFWFGFSSYHSKLEHLLIPHVFTIWKPATQRAWLKYIGGSNTKQVFHFSVQNQVDTD